MDIGICKHDFSKTFGGVERILWKSMCMWQFIVDAPSNSLKNSNANSKMKTMEEGVKVLFLVCNTLGVRGGCWSSRMGRTSDKQINYSYELAQTKQQVG